MSVFATLPKATRGPQPCVASGQTQHNRSAQLPMCPLKQHKLSASASQLFRAPLVSTSDASRAAADRRGSVITRAAAVYGTVESSAPAECYIALGLAHCFEKDENGKLQDLYIIEPIAAPMLECMVTGAKTSFIHVLGTTMGTASARNKANLPPEFADGKWCENYEARLDCAVRTWLRPHAQDSLLDIVPLDKVRSNFNTSLEFKRVLNLENVVNDDDNIKQDMSIDVYGRKDKDEEDQPAAKEEKKAEEEDDDIDGLLSA